MNVDENADGIGTELLLCGAEFTLKLESSKSRRNPYAMKLDISISRGMGLHGSETGGLVYESGLAGVGRLLV